MSFNKKDYQKGYLESQNNISNRDLVTDDPTPNYEQRNTDHIFPDTKKLGVNAQIVVGRDRFPRDPNSGEFIDNKKPSNTETSGYATYLGSSAIDIVVGRGAPFPLDKKQVPNSMPPLYTTEKSNVIASLAQRLADGETLHEGVVMDAGRIYISQMCDIDKYFSINNPEFELAQGPSSAIMMKADRLRMHSRRDIIITAGGDYGYHPNDKIDSNGYSIGERPKIHIMAGNGKYKEAVREHRSEFGRRNPTRPGLRGQIINERITTAESLISTGQGPAVRGDNLLTFLNEVLEMLQNNLEVLNNFIIDQKQLNNKFSNHIHGVATGLTTQDPICQVQNVVSQIGGVRDMISVYGSKFNNLPVLRMNYLEKSGKFYINSRYITIT